jgi:hypothetical protein
MSTNAAPARLVVHPATAAPMPAVTAVTQSRATCRPEIDQAVGAPAPIETDLHVILHLNRDCAVRGLQAGKDAKNSAV